MPELNRSFIKGKMNKDLDERLLPANEYRDAMNISISTSENSDVGAIENLVGTKFLDNVTFKKPLNYRTTSVDQSGDQILGRFFFSTTNSLNPGIKNSDGDDYIFPPAQVVGAKEDATEDRIYYFVKDAAGFTASQSTDSNTIYTGVRSDCIVEATPNELNYRFAGASIIPVFTDVYEVRVQVPAISSATSISGANGSGVDFNGLEPGMTVKAISSNGNTIDAFGEDIEITKVGVTNHTNTTTNKLTIHFSKAVTLTQAQINEGAVLVCEKPKILNFTSGTAASYTDANEDTVLSPTPDQSIITAIDVFDGMLFFTDGRNEPKKINIIRCIKGTVSTSILDNNASVFSTTKLRIPFNSNSTLTSDTWNTAYAPSIENANSGNINEAMTEKHLTVIRPAPLMPPRIFMSNDARDTDVFASSTTNVDSISFNLSSAAVGSTSTIPMSTSHGFLVGDNIEALNAADDKGVNGTITSLLTDGSSNSLVIEVTSITGTIDNSNVVYDVTRLQTEDEKLFKQNFVRFAYRYVYPDGEISSLSPFSNPTFMPRTYSMDAKESFNKGMENDLALLKLQNFAPQNMPLDAIGVDILYKEDISPNIYFVRNIKGCKLFPSTLNDDEFEADGFINETLFTDASYSSSSFTVVNKGSITMDSEQFGSTIPSNQILRSYDNVPKTAKAQAISANRVIYANYKQAYDLETGEQGVLRPEINLSLRDIGGVTLHEPVPSIKSQRTYQVGVVYKGPHGRETSVLIDKNSSITSSINLSDRQLRLQAEINSLAPIWATHYKLYIKETSNEYYNLVLHRAYSMAETDGEDNAFTILAFNSNDRNKVQEGDFLSVKKKRDGGAATYSAVNNKIKVLSIFNEAPQGASIGTGSETEGKFFVKIKNVTGLISGTGGSLTSTATGIATPHESGSTQAVDKFSAVFEVLPTPDRDVNLYYEASQCYPIKLTEDTICEWVNPGDKVVGFDYVANAASSVDLVFSSTAFVNTITFDYDKNAWAITFKRSDGNAVTANFQADSYKGTLHFEQKDGGKNISEIHFEHGSGSYDDSSTPGNTDDSSGDGNGNTTIFIKPATHRAASNDVEACNITIPWFNCYSFSNGVESDRVRDDFNAPTIANGVKASTVFENFKEENREHSLIFSGIYNSTSGVNRLNEFIQAEPITKDLNPIYGSIQKLVARDTDIVALCEDKVLKILANKSALFNADGNTNVTSNNAVLGTAIPFSGEFGVSKNPESVVLSGYRVYFTDKFRGAVLRLSNDGITPISEYGMSDYFKDSLKDAAVCIGSFNDRLGEYDLSIHTKPTSLRKKSVQTISFNESANGWSSFRSYAKEQGVSLDGEYYTFKHGNIYEHSLQTFRNCFYGVVHSHNAFSFGSSTITLAAPINPNIAVGDIVFTSSGANGDSYVDNNALTEGTTITSISGNVITLSSNTLVGTGSGVLVTRGKFSNSTITTIFNDAPSSVKSFQYLKYEGTQSRILKPDVVVLNSGSAVSTGASITLAALNSAIATGQTVFLTATGVEVGTVKSISSTALTLVADVATTVGSNASLTFADQEYYNNFAKNGWFASSVETDMQSAKVLEFIKKEGKWFNYFKGVESSFTNAGIDSDASGNIDAQEFSVQGIARVSSSSFAGDIQPGITFSLKALTDGAQDVLGQANTYTANNFTINDIQSIANGNDTATGTITFTPTQSPNSFITISPTQDNSIAASEFFVRNGTAGSVADAASDTTFTHGTNGITLHHDSDTDQPLKAVKFTDNGTAFQQGNTVKMSVVFADTTFDENLTYRIPIKRTEGESRRLSRTAHSASIKVIFYDNSGSAIFPFVESTTLVNGAVSSDATVIVDESPVGTGVTSNTLGNFSVGDIVTGTDVDSGQTVSSITNATTFELSSADSIANNTTLTISGFTAGEQYSTFSPTNELQGSGVYRSAKIKTNGAPYLDETNLIHQFRFSAGTNKKFVDGFASAPGLEILDVTPASQAQFVSVDHSFAQDGSGNNITYLVKVHYSPTAEQEVQDIAIRLSGKLNYTNGIIEAIS